MNALSLSLLVFFVSLLWLCFARESREAFSFRAPFVWILRPSGAGFKLPTAPDKPAGPISVYQIGLAGNRS